MKHNFLYVSGFFRLGLHPGRSRDPCSSPASSPGTSEPSTQGAHSLPGALSYGPLVGASPVQE